MIYGGAESQREINLYLLYHGFRGALRNPL